MKTSQCVTFLAVGAAIFAGPSVRAFAQPADDPTSRAARDLYQQGSAALDAKDWGLCRARMLAAWAIKKHAQIAGQLGECELNAGLYRDAAEHLQSFLDTAPAATEPALRSHAEDLLARAKAKIATVTLFASVLGTEVVLDGKPIDKLEATVYLDPGHHALEGRKDGYDAARVAIDVAAGSSRAITLTPSKPASKSVPLLLAGGAIAVAGLVAGSVNLALSDGKHADAVALSASIRAGGGHCQATPTLGFEATCQRLHDLSASRDSMHAFGIGALAVGGVAAGLTVGYLLLPKKKEDAKNESSLVVGPVIGEIAGVVARGTF